MERILAIDPGPTHSAYVVYEGGAAVEFGKLPNEQLQNDILIVKFAPAKGPKLVIEQVAAMGMSVGAEVFETVFWSGRFAETWAGQGGEWHRMKRHQVKMHLCGNTRAKDANIRQAIIDKFGPGKDKAIGKKASPGPLYGMSGDCWQALALAITFSESTPYPEPPNE